MANRPAGDTRRRHSTLREGVVAGAIAATGVAVWFLFVDLVTNELFFTPTRLGMAFGRVFGVAPMARSETAALVGYTIVHYAGFAVVGILAVGIVHLARRQPTVLAGAFLAFFVAQALIYVFIGLLSTTRLLGHLTWVQISIANVIGAVLIGWKLRRDHPGLGERFDRVVSGRDAD